MTMIIHMMLIMMNNIVLLIPITTTMTITPLTLILLIIALTTLITLLRRQDGRHLGRRRRGAAPQESDPIHVAVIIRTITIPGQSTDEQIVMHIMIIPDEQIMKMRQVKQTYCKTADDKQMPIPRVNKKPIMKCSANIC